METITEGSEFTVKFTDGSEEKIIIRQIPVQRYGAAFKAFEEEDEAELIAISTAKTKADIEKLEPESYLLLANNFSRINATGFFPYAGRRMSLAALKNLAKNPANLSPLPRQ